MSVASTYVPPRARAWCATAPHSCMDKPLIAISIRQPMAWACLHAEPVKDIENRSKAGVFARHEGPLAIHASVYTPPDEYHTYAEMIERVTGQPPPPRERLYWGFIIGIVQLAGVVEASESPWFVGPHGLVLTTPTPLAIPVRCRGQLGLWPVPVEARAQIAAQGVRW